MEIAEQDMTNCTLSAMLRNFGEKTTEFLTKDDTIETQQFIAATVVSNEEIISNTFDSLKSEAESELKNTEKSPNKKELMCGRILVLLNKSMPTIHGEARLFDPDGQLRKKICTTDNSKIAKDVGSEFLRKLEDKYEILFGNKDNYVIFMFSHFLPCTEESHMCAYLLDDYAKQHKQRFVISYDHRFDLTKPKNVWDMLKKNKYIYLVHPRDLSGPSNSDSYSKPTSCGKIKTSDVNVNSAQNKTKEWLDEKDLRVKQSKEKRTIDQPSQEHRPRKRPRTKKRELD